MQTLKRALDPTFSGKRNTEAIRFIQRHNHRERGRDRDRDRESERDERERERDG